MTTWNKWGLFIRILTSWKAPCLVTAVEDKLCNFRKFQDLTVVLSQAELSKIIRITNCKIPCNYNEYKLANYPPKPFTDDFGNKTVFGLLAVSENTRFEEEVLLYPPLTSENIIQSIRFMLWIQKNILFSKIHFDRFHVSLRFFEKLNFLS